MVSLDAGICECWTFGKKIIKEINTLTLTGVWCRQCTSSFSVYAAAWPYLYVSRRTLQTTMILVIYSGSVTIATTLSQYYDVVCDVRHVLSLLQMK